MKKLQTIIVLLLLVGSLPASAETGVNTSALFSLNTAYLVPVEDLVPVPRAHSLEPCYPNPFNPLTTIKFSLAHAASVQLKVYDLKGRQVRTLIAGQAIEAGFHEAQWSGRNDQNQVVAGGVYLCRLTVGKQIYHQRMTLIK